jgi:hypothetical protein
MAIRFSGKLPKAGISKVVFTLPGTHSSMEPKATLAWADDAGRAGLRFLEVPAKSSEQLEDWLAQQMQTPEKAPAKN